MCTFENIFTPWVLVLKIPSFKTVALPPKIKNGKVEKAICTNTDLHSCVFRGPELSAPAFDSHFNQLKAHGQVVNPWIIKRETQWCFQVIVNLLGSSLVGSKEGEATLSTAYQTHQKSSPVRFHSFVGCL